MNSEPDSAPFRVEVREKRGYVLLRVHGVVSNEATQVFTSHLEEIVSDEEVRGVILLLDTMDSMCARAFGAIVSAHIILRYRHRRLVIAGARPNLLNLMQITGLDTVVTVTEDEDAALSRPA